MSSAAVVNGASRVNGLNSLEAFKHNNELSQKIYTAKTHSVLAGDQWWPRTSGGRLRFAHAITHLFRHRFGHFINSNK